MAAFVGVEVSFSRLPGGIPDGIPVLDVEILSVAVIWNVVVAVTRQTKKSGVLIKGIPPAGVRYQAEKVLISEVVDPRKRCLRRCDHILSVLIIVMSEFHWNPQSAFALLFYAQFCGSMYNATQKY